jgi:hypothetical protein
MIYAIQIGSDGPVKFGKSRNPRARLADLQTSVPFGLRLLASCEWHDDNEVIIHHRLCDAYIRGEWFEPTDVVMEVVSLMRAGDFDGFCKLAGRHEAKPRFDKRAYQREYMALWRAGKAAARKPKAERSGVPDRHREGYMREYMRVWRAVKAGRAEWLRA